MKSNTNYLIIVKFQKPENVKINSKQLRGPKEQGEMQRYSRNFISLLIF